MANRRAYIWKVTMLAKLLIVLLVTLYNHHDTNIFKVNSEKWRRQPYFKHLLFSYLNLSVFP